jgi:NitT/TauT family transport system substrate-binding protein
MNRTRFFAGVVLVAATALVPLARVPAGAADQPVTIRVGATGNDAAAEVYYADEMGFFKKHNLNIQITPQRNGAAEAAAVAGGSLDIGEQNVISMSNAHARSLPFVFIAPAAEYVDGSPSTAMIVAKDAAFKTARDLNGKTIAVSALHDLTQTAAAAWIDKNGGDSSTVHFIEMPPSESPAAVVRGTVQAAVVPEPALSSAGNETRIFAKAFSAIAPQFMINGWFSTKDWIAKNQSAAKRFTDAIHEAAVWANSHHAESAKILEKHSRIPASVIEHMTRATYATSFDGNAMQRAIDTAAHYKAIAKPFPASEIYLGSL